MFVRGSSCCLCDRHFSRGFYRISTNPFVEDLGQGILNGRMIGRESGVVTLAASDLDCERNWLCARVTHSGSDNFNLVLV